MADERYVIDIILNARDDVARAVNSATAALGGMDQAVDRSSARMQKLGDIFDRNEQRFQKYANVVDSTTDKLKDGAMKVDAFANTMKRSEDRIARNKEEWERWNAEVKKTESNIKGAETSIEKYTKQLRDLNDQQQGFKKGAKNWTELQGAIDDTEKSLKAAEKRAETLGAKFDEQARKARGYADELKRANATRADGVRQIEQNERALEKEAAAYDRSAKKVIAARKEMAEAARSAGPGDQIGLSQMRRDLDVMEREVRQKYGNMRDIARDQITMKFGADLSEARRAVSEMTAISKAAGRDVNIKFDADLTALQAKAATAAGIKESIDDPIEIPVDVDAGGAIAQLAALRAMVDQSRYSVAAFDNQLRGLLALGAIGLFQPLISGAIGLAGALVQVAGSAAMAGTAIGAGLTSGIAQALPMVGLLVAAFARVAAVTEAVQQFDLMRKQAAAQKVTGEGDDTSSINALKNANEGLADAQRGVVDSHERLEDAQVNLTRARFEARRELQDLILAEREAQLAAEGAALSQEEAQKNLRQAVSTGDISGIARAQLGVDEARLARQQADQEAARASQDLRAQRAGAATRPDTQVEDAQRGVEEARRGIEEAKRAVDQAQRGIDTARASAKQAESDITSAGANLQFFLAQLSDAERGLYRAFLDIRKTWEQNIRPLTDNLIESFTFAVRRVDTILKDASFLDSARRLSEEMASQINRVTREFTSPKWVKFWEEMMGEATKNLGPITETFLDLANIFRRIADAAQPLFRTIVRLVGDAVDDFDKFVGRGKQLRDFMGEAQKHMVSWWHLGRAVLRLFVELLDSGAKGGLDLVRDLTKEINKAAAWIDGHSKKMDRFWKGVRLIMDEIGKTLIALGEELGKSFDPGSVRALGQVMRRVFIPALGEAVRAMGELFQFFEKLTRNEAVAELAKMAIAVTIFMKVVNTLVHMMGGLVAGFARVGQAIDKVTGGALGKLLARLGPVIARFGAFAAAAAPVVGIVAAVAAAFIYLADKFGVLDDIVDAIKDAFGGIVDAVKEPIADIIDSAKDIGRALGVIGGEAQGVGKIFRWLFVTIVQNGLIPAIKYMGTLFENVFGGIAQAVKGAMDIVAGVLTGDLGRIIGGIKDVFGGVFRIITAPFRASWQFIKDIFGGIAKWIDDHVIDPIGNKIGDIGDFFADAFHLAALAVESAINKIIDIINFFITKIGLDEIGEVNFVTSKTEKRRARAGQTSGGAGRSRLEYAEGGRVGFAGGGRTLQPQPTDAAGFLQKAAGNVAGTVEDIINWIGDSGKMLGWDFNPFRWVGEKAIDFVTNLAKSTAEEGIESALKYTPLGPAMDVASGIGDLFGATGGRAEGAGGIDNIPAWLTRGEFVVTPSGERILENMTGIPGVLNWLSMVQQRATGFAAGGRVGFAEGGRASGRAGDAAAPAASAGPLFEQIMELLNSFGSDATDRWDDIWSDISKTADKAIDKTVGAARRGFRLLGRLMNRLAGEMEDDGKKIEKTFDQMRKKTAEDLNRMGRNIRQQISEANSVIKRGMANIIENVNKGLSAFGVDKISLSSSPAKSGSGSGPAGGRPGSAGGGFIGMAGERGGDYVPALLGRGEAVLNFAHQRVVDPALRAMYGYGLGEMFGRVKGKHGQEAGGGFATGGMVRIPGDPNLTGGRDTVNQSVVDLASWLVRKFNLEVGYAYDPGGGHVSPGHNVTGTALDVVPGPGGSWDDVNAAVQWATSKGMTVYYDGRFGSTALENHGEGNHAHFELKANVVEGGAIMGEIEVKRQIVEGTMGAMKELAQGALDMLQKAGQQFADEQGMTSGGGDIEDLPQSWDALNKVFGPGVTLAHNVVAALAEWAGLPGETFADIAKGESSYQPAAHGHDPGGTEGLGLWQITTGFNDEIIAKYGGMQQMFNPVKNALAAKEIYDAQGIGAWYGTGFVEGTNQHYEGEMPADPVKLGKGGYVNQDDVGEEFDKGGVVGRRSLAGAAIPIMAHAGEWVLNTSQQLRLAGALGSTLSGLKGLLGFEGPSGMSFAEGGEVENWLPRFFEKFAEHFGHAFRRLFGEDPTFANKIYGAFAPVIGDIYDGIKQFMVGIAELGKTSKDFAKDVARVLTQPNRNRRGSDSSSAVSRSLDLMGGLEKVIGHAGQLFKSSEKDLAGTITKFFDGLAGEGGLFDQLTVAFDNLVVVMSTKLNQAIVRTNRKGKVMGRDLQPGQIIDRELDDLRDQLRFLLGQKGLIAEALRQAKRALIKARRQGDQDAIEAASAAVQNLQDRQRENNALVADMQISIMEKIEEKLRHEADRISQRAESDLSGFDSKTGKFGSEVRRAIAEAMGFLDLVPALAQRSIEIMQRQQEELRRLLRRAQRRGDEELAAELESEIASLETEIVNAAVDMITFAADEVARQADRRSVQTDYAQTLLDVQAGMGDVLGAEMQRGAVIQQERAGIEAEIAGLQGVLANAIAQGMGEGVTGPLEDQITELNGELAENTLAQYENTVAILEAQQTQVDQALDMVNAVVGLYGAVADLQAAKGDQVGAAVGQGQILQGQQAGLQQALEGYNWLFASAVSQGLGPDVIEPLRMTIIDLQTQLIATEQAIYENTIAIIEAQQHEIDQAAAREQSWLDLQNVYADVQEGFGDRVGAEQQREGLLESQRSILEDQLAGYYHLLGSAMAQGLHDDVTDPLRAQINELVGELEQNRLALYENTIAQLAAVQELAERGFNATERTLNLRERFAAVRSGFGDTLGGLQDERGILGDRRSFLNQQLDQYQQLLIRAMQQGLDESVTEPLRDTIADLQGSIEENRLALYENTIAQLAAVQELAERGFAATDRSLNLRERFAAVQGGFGDIQGAAAAEGGILGDRRSLLTAQLLKYQELLGNAIAEGLHHEVTDPLRDTIADLQGALEENRLAIYENTVAQLGVAQELAERGFTATERSLGLQERLAGVRAGFGDTVGAAQAQGGILAQRGSLLNQQLVRYQELLASAIAQGMAYEVTDPLRDTIVNLIGSIEENSLAVLQNTVAQRDAQIALIQSRQEFTGGVFGSLRGILDSLGSVTGTPNLSLVLDLVQRGVAQLTLTGDLLREQMENFTNSNIGALPGGAISLLNTLQGLHGEEFVTAIMGLNLSEIVNSLGGPASPLAQQFQALLQAIIDNESALIQNTEELQNLQSERDMQQFTSTAWQWFRQAVFTGMGGLLPEYEAGTPYMQEGGDVTNEGLHFLHAGEYVVPERFAHAARALMSAGSLAGMMSSGSMVDLYGPTAIGASGTMGGGFAQSAGVNTATELRQLKDAMLKQRQHIETHIHGRETGDDEYLAASIAFRSKIPVT